MRHMKLMLWLFALPLLAQVPMAITPYQVIDARSGVALPCVGCKVNTYAAGTTNPIATYTNAGLGSANTNPVLTNGSGYAVNGSTVTGIWGVSGTCYKIVLTDASNVTMFTQDNICLPPGTTTLAAPVTISGSSGTVLAITATGTAVGFTVSGPSSMTGTSSTSALTLANASGPALTVNNGAVFNGVLTLNSTCTGCVTAAAISAAGASSGFSVSSTSDTFLQVLGAGLGGHSIFDLFANGNANCWAWDANSGSSLSLGYTNSCGGVYSLTNQLTFSPTGVAFSNSASGGSVATFTNSGSSASCAIQPAATALVCSSDARLKQHDQPIYRGMDFISKLRPVTFEWRIEPGARHPGFIAQEVQKINPALVATDKDGLLTLNETAMIPYLVAAMQEQQKEISELRNNHLTGYGSAAGIGLFGLLLWKRRTK